MAVPKAAVDKHYRMVLWEYEVWLSGKAGQVEPVSKARCEQQFADLQLRLRVRAANSRHAVAPTFRRQYIGHLYSLRHRLAFQDAGLHHVCDVPRNLPGEERRHRIPDLYILLGARALKEIVVWECLDSRSFANSPTPTLAGVMVNAGVPVLREVRSDRGGFGVCELYPETVIKKFVRLAGSGGVLVFGKQFLWEVFQLG